MSDKYKIFINTTEEIGETIDTLDGVVINPNEILNMEMRIRFLKIILVIISSLFYVNSNLTPIIDLLKKNKHDFKMITYGIFNPGAGLFISGILFFNDEDGKTIISLIGVLFGILLMFCPYILAAGLYLLKVLNNILNLYLIKMFFIYFGTL